MDTETSPITRDASGRFVPGQSGNPAGKLPGTRNRASVLAEALRGGEAEDIARVVIDKAVAGDAVAARFCLGLLTPKPRGRAIRLQLPADEGAGGTVVAMFNSALHAMAEGDITPDEAVQVARFLEGRWRVLRAWQMEHKLTWSPTQLPIPGDDWVPEEEAEEAPSPNSPPPPAGEGRVGEVAAAADPADDVQNPGFPHLDPPPQAGEEVVEEAGGTPLAGPQVRLTASAVSLKPREPALRAAARRRRALQSACISPRPPGGDPLAPAAGPGDHPPATARRPAA